MEKFRKCASAAETDRLHYWLNNLLHQPLTKRFDIDIIILKNIFLAVDLLRRLHNSHAFVGALVATTVIIHWACLLKSATCFKT